MHRHEKVAFIVAHPDDGEVLFGLAICRTPKPIAIIACDGEASTVDMVGNDFVALGNRRQESITGLGRLGITREHQYYLSNRDTNLLASIGSIIGQVADVVIEEQPDALVTFGPRGFDGHLDHVTMHRVGLHVAAETNLPLYVRSDLGDSEDDIIITGDLGIKLHAIQAHQSQAWNVDPHTLTDRQPYIEQLGRERYNEVRFSMTV